MKTCIDQFKNKAARLIKHFSTSIFLVLLLAASLLAQNLVVTFLDCGQGDAIVVQTPAKKTYLIDAGPSDEDFGGTFDAGKMVVAPYLRARHLETVDGILISHPHLDHYGGAFAILQQFKVGLLMDSGTPFLSLHYQKLLKEAEILKAGYKAVKAGDKLDWDPEMQVDVLWPPKVILDKRREKNKNLNDSSVVLKITHGKNTFLFPGDVEKKAEQDLVDDWAHELHCKVLKAPHHGSKTSSTKEFLDAVDPVLVVISCGRHNKFKHPSPSTLKRLEERKIQYYRTDRDGTVEVTSDGTDLSVKTIPISPAAKAP